MRITKEIEINCKVTKEGIVCGDLESFYFCWGARTIYNDLRVGVIKRNGKYIIPFDVMDERIEFLQSKFNNLRDSLKFAKELRKKGK